MSAPMGWFAQWLGGANLLAATNKGTFAHSSALGQILRNSQSNVARDTSQKMGEMAPTTA